MGCEESFITIKPIWHSYLIPSLNNYAHKTPTETGLRMENHTIPVSAILETMKNLGTTKRHPPSVWVRSTRVSWTPTTAAHDVGDLVCRVADEPGEHKE